MSDKELIEYIRTFDSKFDSHLERGTIEMSNEYYNLVEELLARGITAIKENKQLQEKVTLLNKMNEENYEKYCNELKKNKKAIEYVKGKTYVVEMKMNIGLKSTETEQLLEILENDNNVSRET